MWLVPSRRRPQNLAKQFDALRSSETTTPGLVLVDQNDYRDLKAEYDALACPEGWQIIPTEGESMGDKVREMWPRYANLDWVGLMGDDNLPETKGWDQMLIKALTGWNIVSSNDGWQAPHRMAGATLWSGDLFRAVGYIYPTELQHLFIDDIWETLGRRTDCWHVRMDVMVRHAHVFISGIQDETHKKAYSNWPNDEARYLKWKSREMFGVLAAIRDLMRKRGAVVSRPPVEIRIPLTM